GGATTTKGGGGSTLVSALAKAPFQGPEHRAPSPLRPHRVHVKFLSPPPLPQLPGPPLYLWRRERTRRALRRSARLPRPEARSQGRHLPPQHSPVRRFIFRDIEGRGHSGPLQSSLQGERARIPTEGLGQQNRGRRD